MVCKHAQQILNNMQASQCWWLEEWSVELLVPNTVQRKWLVSTSLELMKTFEKCEYAVASCNTIAFDIL